MSDKNLYDENSIQKLDPLSFTRLRPDTYCGSTEDSTQLARELITNCIDEHLIGNCDEVFIKIDGDKVVVSDKGQGIIPNLPTDDDKTVLEMVYGDINSSGKYDKSDDAVYKVSTGAFGIGASLTNFLSHYLIAETKRDGQFERVYFKEGRFDKRETGTCGKDEHGVSVEYQASEEFFVDSKPNVSELESMLNNISCICPNIIFYLNDKTIKHPNGIADLLAEKIDDDISIISAPLVFDIEMDRQKLNLGLTFGTKSSSDIVAFCNYGLIEAGTPITAIKSCLTKVLNKWAKSNGILSEKDKNLDGSSLQEGLHLVFNLVSPSIRYDSQTKVRVTSTEDNAFVSETFGEQLEIWLDNNPDDAKAILEKAIIARKASEAAKKARAAVKSKAAHSGKKKFLEMPTTLIDCNTKDRSKAELFIVEGLSAASSLVAQRNGIYQSIYSVRGMMLNVQKVTENKIVENKEINNLIMALGLDYNPKDGKMVYDKRKLRFGKIIAASDADAPGAAIENLLFNILWQLCPELIVNGHVYSAEPPLFRATLKDNSYHFLADQRELNDFQKKHKDIKDIQRAKGLAEMLPEQLAESVLHPETRKLTQLTVKDIDRTNSLFMDLYGKNVEPRLAFINENPWGVQVDYE